MCDVIMDNLPNIITALGTIILGWFTYNQYRKNKMTDLEIERIKKQDKIDNKRRSDNSTLVFGELWNLLYELNVSFQPLWCHLTAHIEKRLQIRILKNLLGYLSCFIV